MKLNYDNVPDFGIFPEGVYEMVIDKSTEEIDTQGRPRISIVLVCRNDVCQAEKNRLIYHSIYKSKEPKPVDAETNGYSFTTIMGIAKALNLPTDKDYPTLAAVLNDMIHRPVKVTIRHDEYNGNKTAKVKYWNTSDFPEVHHTFKNTGSSSGQWKTGTPATFPMTASTPQWETVSPDEDLPF